jgi:hypothetical protein
MRRRDFIVGLGSAAARAQQALLPVIGILNPASADTFAVAMSLQSEAAHQLD